MSPLSVAFLVIISYGIGDKPFDLGYNLVNMSIPQKFDSIEISVV